MGEAATVSKPAIAQTPGNQYGTLIERLAYWARFATRTPERDVLLEAARELQKIELNAKGK